MEQLELNGGTYNVSSAEEDGVTTYTVHCSQRVGGRTMFVLQHDGSAWVESQQVSILRQAEPDVLDFLLSGMDMAEEPEAVEEEEELLDGEDESPTSA